MTSGDTCHGCNIVHSTWGSSGDIPGADIPTLYSSPSKPSVATRKSGKTRMQFPPQHRACVLPRPWPGPSMSGPARLGSTDPVG